MYLADSLCKLINLPGISKYTWIRVAHGRAIERALMDYVLITKRMVGRLKDVHVFRGVARVAESEGIRSDSDS